MSHPFLIIVPSDPLNPSTIAVYYKVAQHIALSWYIFGRGATQIVLDSQVYDGDAARYNMIVLGGPEDNLWTRRREKEGGRVMVKFLEKGGYQIGTKNYTGPGVGIIFLGPNPTRTRVGVYISGTDKDGFMKAAWSIPFRTGTMVPDYMVVGPEFGDPVTGWTGNQGIATKGAGGIMAAGFWSNFWEFDDRCGYLT